MNNPGDRFLRYGSTALLGFCLLQIVVWLPGYLTRPLFADHDVFATMARSWDGGLAPYRDLVSNNFPGTIYLFWGLGKVFGWGSVPAFYAADVVLLLVVIAMTLRWSQARFGRILPGAVGMLALTSYYLELDFSQTAQRDWHACLLVMLGLLAAQAWPERGGRWLAALGFASGMLVRPQVILILPAMLLAVTERNRLSGASRAATIKAATVWTAVVALAVALGFLPVALNGLMGDFFEGLRAVAYGGAYNKKSLGGIIFLVAGEIASYRISAVILSLALLARAASSLPGRSLAMAWSAALIGVLLYAPLSPGLQPYLFHPIWIVWSLGLAVLVGLILESDVPPKGTLYVILILSVAGISWPRFCQFGRIRDSLVVLSKGHEGRLAPSGYEHLYGNKLVLPPWEDYRDLLDHLRTRLAPGTRVANLLKGVAITGPTGRMPALPAESMTWVFVVKPGDELRFAQSLEACPDSVVVMWAPGVVGKYDHPLPKVEEVVRRFYVPDARFGTLEVWRRRPNAQTP